MAWSRSGVVLAIVAVTVVALVTSAHAGIIIDSQTTINGPGGAHYVPVDFGSYDASGSDKLVVLVGGGRDRGSSLGINGVTYGGTTLTEAVKASSTVTSPQGVATGVYYLDSPGAAGNLVVDYAGAVWGIRNAITVLELLGTEAGHGPVGSSANSASASLTTVANDSLVLAISKAVPDSSTETPLSPLTDLTASRHGAGYQFVASPAAVSPTFSTGDATVVAAFAPAAGGPGPAPEPLLIDFNSTNQDGGPHNQAGYAPYDARHEVPADFDTKTFSAFGTTVSVTPDWPNTTDNRVQQMIDRGGGNDANWDNADGDIDLVTDFLGIDTRTGNGGNGNWDGTTGTPTYMTLALGGLPAGMYDWKSFHHDTENVHGDFAVEVSTDGGATWEELLGGLMTDSTSGGNPGSEGFTPPGPWTGPDADLLPSTYEFSFLADGQNDVLLRFAPLANTAVHRQIWGINGFELTQADVIPEPATLSLLGLGALLALRRRRRGR